ncbi:hypothetical protein [Pontibacter fetidus]|uniref:Uncharacterized protein n=1 Tax=Pontibacter fetidus TaxID=2700082 RepID=A0A6B2H452_9BACT|nr:hypothetical protein [Pontibacter fetidus]NDK56888.1 hypothetical protein [Pontibacter fetidus]
MYRFTSYIAIVLLLLFARVMVPDALILELHPHTHTIHNAHEDAHKAQVGQKHKHCPVEDNFHEPFQGSWAEIAIAPSLQQKTAYVNFYQNNWHTCKSTSRYLRGPPIV